MSTPPTRPASPRRLALVLLALGLAGFALLALAVLLRWPLESVDQSVAEDLSFVAHNAPSVTGVVQLITHLGDRWTIALFGAFTATMLWLVARRPALAGVWGATLLVSVGLNEVIKRLVHRPRPPESNWLTHADGWSFPSGHAMGAATCYGLIAWVLVLAVKSTGARIAVVVGAVLVTAAVAFSRMYLGVHYLSDVLAGMSAGTACVFLAVLVLELLRREAPAELTPPPAPDPSTDPSTPR